MIYVYTEDRNEGMALMRNAIDIYLSNSNIIVNTLDGIKNLQNSIKNLSLNPEDAVYYIYDDIAENADVQMHLKNGKKEISRSKYRDQIKLIPIFCCEHTILMATDIEKFSHSDALRAVLEVREYRDLKNVTKMTKQNKIFDDYYNKARKKRENTLKRIQRNKGIVYNQNDIENGVTVEKLYKEIIKDALRPPLAITALLGNCWTCDCCINKNRVCSMHINNNTLYKTEKKQFLVDRTVYIKIIKHIASEQKLSLKSLNKLKLDDKQLNKRANQIIKEFNIETHNCMLKCKQHIKQYVKKAGNKSCTKWEIIDYCTSLGYTENQAEIAFEHIVKQLEKNS